MNKANECNKDNKHVAVKFEIEMKRIWKTSNTFLIQIHIGCTEEGHNGGNETIIEEQRPAVVSAEAEFRRDENRGKPH